MTNTKWHKVKNYEVLVEDGKVVRGTYQNSTVYPYRKNGDSWIKEEPKLSTLRSGLENGNWQLR